MLGEPSGLYKPQDYLGQFDIEDLDQLKGFLNSTFVFTRFSDYPDLVDQNLSQHPQRITPDFLQFFAEISLMSAEYGFPDSSGHIIMHGKGNFQRDFLDPRHLLALGVYMANINVQAYYKRLNVINTFIDRAKNRDDFPRQVWGMWVRPVRGNVDFPAPEDFRRCPAGLIQKDRLKDNLPIIVPDIVLHETLSSFNFDGKTADQISMSEIKTDYAPILQAVMPLCDIERVFYEE